MVRIKIGAPRRQKKNRYFKAAKGFRGGRSTLWRTVRETLLRAWAFSSRDRRTKKRMFRRLWIIRLNAAARVRGMNYSTLVDGLKKAGIELDRKQLSEIAIKDPAGFAALVAEARTART